MCFLENVCVYVCVCVGAGVGVGVGVIYSRHNSKPNRDIKFIIGKYMKFILELCKVNCIVDRIILSI